MGQAAARDDFEVDLIDLADFAFPPAMTRDADVQTFTARIGVADAFVVVTPSTTTAIPAR
jgi:NAD(P)H-dependent FMN reductase